MVALIHNRCTGPTLCMIGKTRVPMPGLMGGEACACACHRGAKECSDPLLLPTDKLFKEAPDSP